jgi:hypothetical protein
MPQEPAQPMAGNGPPDQVRARVAAAYQLLARSRQRAAFAMAHVRYIDLLLHSSSQRSSAAESAGGPGLEHVTEVVEHEVATHLRAVELHETAAQLQEEGGWPARAAAARAHAAHARELARRAREELAHYRAQATAAREQVDELKRREPQHRDGHAAGGKDTGAHHGRP